MTPLPHTDIELSEAELLLLKPGLKLLVDGLADAQRGLFPHRRAWDRIDLVSTDVYRGKAYDAPMHRLVVKLHSEIRKPTVSTIFRWDPIQLAAAQLALRLYVRGSSQAVDKQTLRALGNKLEKFRKRAKRLCVGQDEANAYQRAAAVWQAFLQWTRYHLLQYQAPACRIAGVRKDWSRQRETLTTMVNEALRERCFHPLPEEDIDRLVTLVKAELRRGRHRLTLKGIIDSPVAGKEVLFDFVEKRRRWRLIPAQGAVLPLIKRTMLLEATFRARSRTRSVAASSSADTEQDRWIAAALRSYRVPLDAKALGEQVADS